MTDDNQAVARESGATDETTGVDDQVRRIQDKLQQLLRQRDLLLKENGKLKDELRRAREIQAEVESKRCQLQQQVEALRVTRTEMSEGEKRELEKRLAQYIREIDRCIALLGE
ncbi:MAG TPA: hypothetical protein VGR89_08315 [Puia sp.]|nr:hypothetical protein [Puia sp.]